MKYFKTIRKIIVIAFTITQIIDMIKSIQKTIKEERNE